MKTLFQSVLVLFTALHFAMTPQIALASDQKSILVTGASSGIGRACSSLLLTQGYAVIGVARDFAKFPCNDPQFTARTIDLSDLDGLPAQLEHLLTAPPVIDAAIERVHHFRPTLFEMHPG